MDFLQLLQFSESSEIPYIIQNFGLAILTILIPFAIAIFTKILQEKEGFPKLDLFVMIDEVFKLRLILISVIFIFLPLFFWNTSSIYTRCVEAVISLFAISFIGVTIWKIYEWIKGNTFKYRFNYLERLKNPQDMKIVFEDIWRNSAKNLNLFIESKFLSVFLSKIEKFLSHVDKKNKKFPIEKKSNR